MIKINNFELSGKDAIDLWLALIHTHDNTGVLHDVFVEYQFSNRKPAQVNIDLC